MNSKGFTLMEVLISLVILAGTSLTLYVSWSGSLLELKRARTANTTAMLLQRKVAEFEAVTKEKRIEELQDSDSGDFGAEFPDYSWEINVKPFSIPLPALKNENGENLDEVTEALIKNLFDYLEKAVRQVEITVIRKAGKKNVRNSVGTVFVDYKVEIPLGF